MHISPLNTSESVVLNQMGRARERSVNLSPSPIQLIWTIIFDFLNSRVNALLVLRQGIIYNPECVSYFTKCRFTARQNALVES